jgi:DNA-binding NarL/FixJ family response regulator
VLACTGVAARRRVTAQEERELLKAAAKLKAVEDQIEQRRRERDQLIADLLDSGARVVDIAEILKITAKAVRDARERAHRH